MEDKQTTASVLSVFILVLIQNAHSQRLCIVPPGPVLVSENNTADVEVVQIDTSLSPDLVLDLLVNPDDLFYLQGNALMAKRGLDFEALSSPTLTVWVQCKTENYTLSESVEVLVENINDNPPNFDRTHYVLDVNELSPVNSSVGLIEATDIDSDPLYYRLEPASDKYFRLENTTSPKIVVKSVIDYDTIQKISLVLHVQDTFNGSASNKPFFTSVATLTLNIRDVDNRPPWFQPCVRTSLGPSKLCVSSGYKGRVNLTEKEEGPLVLEPGPVFAKDGDRNRSEQISYKILKGNEGNLFQMDEDTGNITMTKAADVLGPITLTVIASQVQNRDQFAVTQVVFEVMKKSRSPPRFEKERFEGFIYSNSVPESLVLRDRSTNRPFRVRARDEDFATGINPDVKYEVQYSSYVNVTTDGFVILKRVVKTESFALQLRAVDTSTGEFGTAALSVQVIPAVAIPSPASGGYRPGDMALLGLVMAALLVLCLIVIGFLLSRVLKGDGKICQCLGPCFSGPQSHSHRDSLQFTNDGFQTEVDSRGRWGGMFPKGKVLPLGKRSPKPCSSCGTFSNHIHRTSPMSRRSRELRNGSESGLMRPKRKEGQKSVWFKESENSSEIEVEIIPDTTILDDPEETQEEEEPKQEVEVVRDPKAPIRDESQETETNQENTATEKMTEE
ncbi:cadherin-related family member 5 [Periophthalmus magnuspinnatus]|uniref:cadherin-related family member 5 n=1 Tax=Periophthalmus magnuspinnatus TaxID=409849 RepID=UPI0024372020|nr:cadherin-related family member 5 [Periophthalmus magnuspinnatus]